MDNETFISSIIEATDEVLSIMAGMHPVAGVPVVNKTARARGDVSGVISLVNDTTKVSLAVVLRRPVLSAILRKMADLESDGGDAMAMSTAGELANMVAGVVQRNLENIYDCSFTLSLPTVVAGDDHVVAHAYQGEMMVIPFSVENGTFFVEFCCMSAA